MKYLAILIFPYFIMSSCGGEEKTERKTQTAAESSSDLFFNNLLSLCDETFVGESTFPDDSEHVLVDTELRAHISGCETGKVEIDLYRDGDTWHTTWVLEKRVEGLHLYHDHTGDQEKDELGEDHLTGYGGYADEHGSSTHQLFPADEYTAEILPEAASNVWSMEFDPDSGNLIYYLERHSSPRFRAVLTLQ